MAVVQIPKVFQPLAESLINPSQSETIYWVYYSGRGTGKSENIAAILVLTMYQNPDTRIACIREFQHSITESIKATLEKWIDIFELRAHFHITGTSLRCHNGSECFFLGLKNSNSPNIKSISNISITFIEEASQISEKSWRMLVPSVTRVKHPKIVIAFNPDRTEDIIYQEFVANTPPKSSVVTRLKWDDNPFFKNSSLYQVMLDDKERLPREVFAHIWEGELAKNIEDSLFKKANFEPLCVSEHYSEIVVGVDPATTNTDHSNEYGIIVAARNDRGECRILQDYTGKYTPREFSSKVVEAYYEYNADLIVVETNQGGDFIASAILDIDNSVRIEEVRAGTGKHNRALPLANMMELGTLRFVDDFPKLRRQMELITLRGYLGPKGESPDALDAAIWAIYHLMGLKEREGLYQVFNPRMFNKRIETNTLNSRVITFLTAANGYYAFICVYGISDGAQTQLVVKDAGISDNLPTIEGEIIAPDIPANYTLPKSSTYPKIASKLDERVTGYISFLKRNPIVIEKGLFEALNVYSYETPRKTDVLVDLFCDIIEIQFNL